jgi:hypothetical protein
MNTSQDAHAQGIPTASNPEPAAPGSWRNWRANREGADLLGIVELKLFSDAWFIGEALGHGPYSFLNPVPRTTRGRQFEWKPAVVLRAEHYLPANIGNMQVTEDDHYHGGSLYDEVAALVALLFGARIIAGPIDREFGYDADPLGRPRAHSSELLPTLPVQVDAPQIPTLFGQRELREISLLDSFPDLDREAAIVLVKSARLYQGSVQRLGE